MDSGQKVSRPALKAARIVLALAILSFLFWISYRDLKVVAQSGFSFDFTYFSGSIFFLILALLLQVRVWKANLKVTGGSIAFWPAFKLYYLANVGRYIPGKIWSVMGFIHLGQKANLPAHQTVGAMVLGLVASLISGFLLGGVFIWLAHLPALDIPVWLPLALLAGGVALMHPRLSNFVLKIAARITKREIPPYPYTFSSLLKLLGLYGAVWLFYSISFALLVMSVKQLTQAEFIFCLGVFPVSYGLGFLAWLSPAGWGAREGGITLLLSQILPTYLAVAVALTSRVILTVCEGILFAAAWRVKWNQSK
jgi:hypothetical protein